MNINTDILPIVQFWCEDTTITVAADPVLVPFTNQAMLFVRGVNAQAGFDDNGLLLPHVQLATTEDGTTTLSLSNRFAAAVGAFVTHMMKAGDAKDKIHGIQTKDFLALCKQYAMAATAG